MSDIDKKYNELGGAAGVLGNPVSSETTCKDGIGRYRHYDNGSIYWTPGTGAHAVYGLIWNKWKDLGFEKGPNGYPQTDEADTQSKRGRNNDFQNGTIIWLAGTNEAFCVYGDIYAKWGQLKWDIGELGFPTTDETPTPNGVGRYNHFEHGSIYWTPETGAHVVKGVIRATWAAQGWEQSQLGYPLSDEMVTPNTKGQGRYQVFQGGDVYWTPQYGARIALDNVIRLPMVVIRVSDKDGTNGIDASSFSDETIRALIDVTNAVYEPDAGIKLVLQQISSVSSNRINRLEGGSHVECAEITETINHPDLAGHKLSPCTYEAYTYAAQNYPGTIVVYIRKFRYYDNCLLTDSTGGFSDYYYNFVALGSWGPTGTLGVMILPGGQPIPGQSSYAFLAHELGHYFHITHPMPNVWPKTQEEATKQLDEFCKNNYKNPADVPDSLPSLVWNLDQLGDTPGDPGYCLYNKVIFNVGEGQETATKNQCIGPGEYTVYSNFCQREFTVRPARHNVMSYTADCPYLPGNTTGESRARITPMQRDRILGSLSTDHKYLSRAPYRTMWISTWSKGWTHLMPFILGGRPHFIAYNATTGEVHFDRLHKPPDGLYEITGYDTLMKSTWGTGWSQLMPFTLNNKPHFIAYNSATGEVHFDRINDDGKGFAILVKSTWGTGWSQLMPFTLNNKPHFIAYNSATGEVHFDRINDDGKGFAILMKGTLGTGWSQLMPFTLNNKPHFIAYNSSTGEVHFDRINDDGTGFAILMKGTWGKGWTHLIPYWHWDDAMKQKWMFIAYNSATGEVHFDRINDDGKGVDIRWKENWAPGWSLLMPFHGPVAVDMGTYRWFPYFIAYTAKLGKVIFHQAFL
jgi:hypothetical protein